jgi:hypothetical protein
MCVSRFTCVPEWEEAEEPVFRTRSEGPSHKVSEDISNREDLSTVA